MTAIETPARRHGLLVALFGVYVFLLVWLVLFKLEAPWVGLGEMRRIKLVPFAHSAAYGASTPFDVVANLLLFVPFGLYLGLLAPTWRWWKAAAVIAATSLALEAAQFVLAVGSTDVTDVIVNTAGGVVGLWLCAGAHRLLRARAGGILQRILVVGSVLGAVATAAFLASPVHFAPRDVGVGLHRALHDGGAEAP
ncbi:VanZ family protein [Microbacterium sp. SS28]|uniref:VanZ family protein n=1 Tax=Microbacterium sp. SS28 TaxID=2919948 RepID=UPI001FAA5740|nr:VanZ family protein [Microbacterium sp. SS28]